MLASFVLAFVVGDCLVVRHLDQQRISAAFEDVNVSYVYVTPGSTLWDYASDCDVSGVSTQELVDWIQASNHMESPNVAIGSRIKLPNYVGRR